MCHASAAIRDGSMQLDRSLLVDRQTVQNKSQIVGYCKGLSAGARGREGKDRPNVAYLVNR